MGLRQAAVCLLGLAALPLFAATAPEEYRLPPFSALTLETLPEGWQLTTLRKRDSAEFRVVDDVRQQAGGAQTAALQVLEVRSTAGVAALNSPVALNSEVWPRLAWRWRIAGYIPGSNMESRAGDDFPARVYVTFARPERELSLGTRLKLRLARLTYGQSVPSAAICYVWDASLPVGTAMPNAYSDTIMMVVAETGGAMPSAWAEEVHDVRADYQRLFGEPVPAMTSVIVAQDTDDTGASAQAWFGDIVFQRGPQAADSPN
jgi:hypothetical protein